MLYSQRYVNTHMHAGHLIPDCFPCSPMLMEGFPLDLGSWLNLVIQIKSLSEVSSDVRK